MSALTQNSSKKSKKNKNVFLTQIQTNPRSPNPPTPQPPNPSRTTKKTDRGMLFCFQEALLYLRGKDPICPGYRPRWWPATTTTTTTTSSSPSPQIRAPLVGSWFEGRRVGAASLLPWQMRQNLFGEGALEGAGNRGGAGRGGAGLSSRVRADGTRVPPMLVLPLSALRER